MKTYSRKYIRMLKQRLADAMQTIGRLVRVMEVCGTHTVSFFRSGLRADLPENLKLISGPGCPVCVTSQGYIDAVVDLARRGVTIATYGDMVRVPGNKSSLEKERAAGARVEVVYSIMDALELAQREPDEPVVFVAVGFETTAPATAAAVLKAHQEGIGNFYILTAHKLVVPAMLALLASGDIGVDGFLCPGHVSVIIGWNAYQAVVDQYHMPCVVAGFEPAQMLLGLCRIVEQLVEHKPALENVYGVAVTGEGNRVAQRLLDYVFEPVDEAWRAMGTIPGSGAGLREPFKQHDALRQFDVELGADYDAPGCRCGDVIRGLCEPADCRLFGKPCTPIDPIGPCMVSSEGTCAAWYKYGGARGGEERRARFANLLNK